MNQEELSKKLLSPSKNSRLEKLGKGLTFACLSLIVIIVAMILIFYLGKLGILLGNNSVPYR